MSTRKTLKVSLLFLGLICSLALLYLLYLDYRPELQLLFNFHGNYQLLIKMIRSHGPANLVLVFLLNAICVAIPGLSNGIFCVLNGILFGPAVGFLVNWASDILGQLLLLYLIRKLYSPKKLRQGKFYRLLHEQSSPELAFSLAYAIPFIPSITVSFANILVNSAFKKRLIPIIIGSLPLAFLYAYGGDSLLHLNGRKLLITILILLLIALIAIGILYFNYRRTKKAAAH